MHILIRAAKAVAFLIGGALAVYLLLVLAGGIWLWNSTKKAALPRTVVSSGVSEREGASRAGVGSAPLDVQLKAGAISEGAEQERREEEAASLSSPSHTTPEKKRSQLSEADRQKVALIFQNLAFASHLEAELASIDPCKTVCQASELRGHSGESSLLATLPAFYEARGASAFEDPRFVGALRIFLVMGRMFPASLRELMSEAMDASENDAPFYRQLWLSTRLATELPSWSLHLKKNSESLKIELERAGQFLKLNKKCLGGELSRDQAQELCRAEVAER